MDKKRLQILLSVRNIKFLKSITVKFFENSDLNGSSKIRDAVFEEGRQNITVTIIWNSSNVSI